MRMEAPWSLTATRRSALSSGSSYPRSRASPVAAALDGAVRGAVAAGEGGRAGRGSPLSFLFVTVFVDMIGYGIVVPLLPFYAQGYAAGAVLVGPLGSLYAVAQFFGCPFLGGLSDHAGRRPVLLLCLLGASLAYLLPGLADTLPLLVEAVVLVGLASATLATAQASWAASKPS